MMKQVKDPLVFIVRQDTTLDVGDYHRVTLPSSLEERTALYEEHCYVDLPFFDDEEQREAIARELTRRNESGEVEWIAVDPGGQNFASDDDFEIVKELPRDLIHPTSWNRFIWGQRDPLTMHFLSHDPRWPRGEFVDGDGI
jgi:hypothetical protein